MSAASSRVWQVAITRRSLVKRIGGALFAAVAARSAAGRMIVHRQATRLWEGQPRGLDPATPVVSFFLDQPYLDTTGLATPYQPPVGLRGGRSLAELTEGEFRGVTPHF